MTSGCGPLRKLDASVGHTELRMNEMKMIQITEEQPEDFGSREILLDRAMGPDRVLKPSERLRAGRLPARGLALVARDGGRIVGSVRLWNVDAGEDCPALLLGPLAVDPGMQGAGIGSALMEEAIARAKRLGHGAIILVGDAPYYSRFGFSAELTKRLKMPAPVLRKRFLGLELEAGALAHAAGKLTASGQFDFVPAMAGSAAAFTRAA
jgi:predicted N-acetyltransferase YhbS